MVYSLDMIFVTSCVLVATILGTASAQVFSLGHCDEKMHVLTKFNHTQYVGKWYIVRRSFCAAQENTKCYRATCTLAPNSVLNYAIDVVSVDGYPHSVSSCMTSRPDPNENFPGKMTVEPGFIEEIQPIWHLDTDYKTYSIVYSCANAYNGKLETVWVGARSPQATKEICDKVDKVLKHRKIHVNLFDEVQDCE